MKSEMKSEMACFSWDEIHIYLLFREAKICICLGELVVMVFQVSHFDLLDGRRLASKEMS